MKFNILDVPKLLININSAIKLDANCIIYCKVIKDKLIMIASSDETNKHFKFAVAIEPLKKSDNTSFAIEAARLKLALRVKKKVEITIKDNSLNYSSGNASTGSLALLEKDEPARISASKESKAEFSNKLRDALLTYTKFIDVPSIINKDRINCISIFNIGGQLGIWSGDDFYIGVVMVDSKITVEDVSYPIEYFDFLKSCFEKDDDVILSTDGNFIYFYNDTKILKLPVYLGENDTDKVREFIENRDQDKVIVSFDISVAELHDVLIRFNAIKDNDKATQVEMTLGDKMLSLKADTTKGSMKENMQIDSKNKGEVTLDHRMLSEIINRAANNKIPINVKVYPTVTTISQQTKEATFFWLIVNWKK